MTAARTNKQEQEDRVDIAILKRDVKYIVRTMDEMNSKVVTKDEFDPIQRLVYGLVGLILASVLAAGMALLLK
jgi:thiosulfate reductase cytochrome b subunit